MSVIIKMVDPPRGCDAARRPKSVAFDCEGRIVDGKPGGSSVRANAAEPQSHPVEFGAGPTAMVPGGQESRPSAPGAGPMKIALGLVVTLTALAFIWFLVRNA
jgi:hypothetical protein